MGEEWKRTKRLRREAPSSPFPLSPFPSLLKGMINLENASQGQKIGSSFPLLWKGLIILALLLSLFSLILTSSYKSTVMKNSILIEALQSKVLETEQKLKDLERKTDKNTKLAFKAIMEEIESTKSQVNQQIKALDEKVLQTHVLLQLQGVYSSVERAHTVILKEGDYTKAVGEVENARNRLSKIVEIAAEDQKANIQKLQQSLQEIAIQLQNPTPSVVNLLGEIMNTLGNENNIPAIKPETPPSGN